MPMPIRTPESHQIGRSRLTETKLIQDYPELAGDISDIGAIGVVQNQAKLLEIFRDCGVMGDPGITKDPTPQ